MISASFIKKHKWLLLSLITLSVVMSTISSQSLDSNEMENSDPAYMPVSVMSVSAEAKTLDVTVSGLTQARWTTHITSPVEGRSTELTQTLEPGTVISKGQALVSIDQPAYQMAVDDASSRLSNAKLNLAQITYEQTVVQKSGGVLSNAFARMEPQVEAAGKEVVAAESALKYAQQRLKETIIRAPFNAIVLQSFITPGQWIQQGQQIATIADFDSIDVQIELSEQSWVKINSLSVGSQAKVVANQKIWPATVRSISPMRDKVTHRRSLRLKVAAPYSTSNPLLSDEKVSVIFEGSEYKNLFMLPATAVTSENRVWSVDENNQLISESVSVLKQEANSVWVSFDEHPQMQRNIAIYPMSSMISHQVVLPIAEKVGAL